MCSAQSGIGRPAPPAGCSKRQVVREWLPGRLTSIGSKLHRLAPQVAWAGSGSARAGTGAESTSVSPARGCRLPANGGDGWVETVTQIASRGGGPTSLINGAAVPELVSCPFDRGATASCASNASSTTATPSLTPDGQEASPQGPRRPRRRERRRAGPPPPVGRACCPRPWSGVQLLRGGTLGRRALAQST